MTVIPQPLAAQARARPHHAAFTFGSETFTYAQLATDAARTAVCYHARGIRPHDRVALIGPPDVRMACALHALGWLGAVVVPMPVGDTPDALRARLNRCQAVHVIVLAGTPAAAHTACQAVLPATCHEACVQSACSFCAGGTLWPWPEQAWRLDAPRLVLQTSGTTGEPVSVVLTVGQMLMHTFGSTSRLGHDVADVWLNVLPLHHVGGLMILFRALWLGVTVMIPGRFDAALTAVALRGTTVTLTSLVPTMLARVLPLLGPANTNSPLRAILLGGAPTSQTLLNAALAHKLPVAITWGMTETASQVCTQWPGASGDPQNAGPPLPFAQVSVDATGALCVAGPIVEEAFTTGDMGSIDATGSVHVYGRRDRVLISGGENIAPEEVEAVLLSHAAIADAAVVGTTDAHWGERPVAHLVALDAPVPSDVLVAFCRTRIASFKVPVAFHWHPALPRDGMGKLQRASLNCDAALKEER